VCDVNEGLGLIGVEGLGMEFEIYEVLKVQDWSSRSRIGVQSLGLEFSRSRNGVEGLEWSFESLNLVLN
jgi:hypothetical protein